MNQDDADYYRMRALQEQVAAQNATCVAARERHTTLAAMYRFRAMLVPPAPVSTSEQTIAEVD